MLLHGISHLPRLWCSPKQNGEDRDRDSTRGADFSFAMHFSLSKSQAACLPFDVRILRDIRSRLELELILFHSRTYPDWFLLWNEHSDGSRTFLWRTILAGFPQYISLRTLELWDFNAAKTPVPLWP